MRSGRTRDRRTAGAARGLRGYLRRISLRASQGIVLFTGERIASASARHILGEEASRALRQLRVPDLDVTRALERADGHAPRATKVTRFTRFTKQIIGTFVCFVCLVSFVL